MIWKFRVAYGTVIGESVWLEMALESEGGSMRHVMPMHWADDGHWQAEVEAEVRGSARLDYGFSLRRGDVKLKEWGGLRSFEINETSGEKIVFLDDWRSAGAIDRVYEAKVFGAIADDTSACKEEPLGKGNHEIRLHMSRVPEGLVPCITGGLDAFGDWDYQRALPLKNRGQNFWSIRLDIPADWHIEYKYGLYDLAQGKLIKIENGGNRALDHRHGAAFTRVTDEQYHRTHDLMFRGAGMAIPVFSLRSEEGCGVGEFADLKPMADWAAATGLKMLQILPINDTTSTRTWTDSYPYSAISVYALHPIYLRLDALSFPLPDDADFVKSRNKLNKLKQVDYEAVMDVKWKLTREVFDANRDAIMASPVFRNFLKANWDWVIDYAFFSVKRDEYGTADFTKWGEETPYDRNTAALEINADVMYFTWLQYELDLQLSDAVAYMHSIGVALKGDLPIGIDRESVDAWSAPHLFKMDAQTGAPPDGFAKKGQTWGFPTYDWDVMAKDGYAWWRSRFEKLSRYFDAYRIDHILGFFRIWQVPIEHIEGLLGTFDPALPVRIEEFAERGINFDYDRFCKPYIREDSLKETFGNLADGIRQDFMIDWGLGCYGLREAFATQKGVEGFFAKLKPGDWANKDWIKEALMDLVGEVLFFEVPGSGGKEFHPRMSMTDTVSFKNLDEDTRNKLKDLYNDYFYSRQEKFWEAKALEKLPAMRAASDMLLCGEDLGMVPACVPGVMRDMGMLSLEIQRWPKATTSEFFRPDHAPYMSVVSTGTHDMETLRSWWRDDELVRSRFAWEMFGISLPEKELSGEMASRILAQHLHSPAMWAVFPFQDLLAIDERLRDEDIEGERINVPAIIPYYWRWRMKPTVSELSAAAKFNATLSELISDSGR
ncbi:MAG: 4-alpha-glucanotransferase [Akkermansiaceae bacterium]|nr:4-alpha-glucanotransferase [Akkermansiaceae bacterium]